ncbi:MAG: BrnT family toxin [Deltaproteobacteria bacterium]|nr:BrnT family toxin [Deltaproteobacteria bacterium]
MGKDVLYEFHGFKFSWDSDKAEKNIREHDGISFEIAAQAVVNDVQVVEELDEEGERRFGIISFALAEHFTTPLFVVVADAGEDAWRIISARKATSEERRRYEKEINSY